MIIKVLLLVGLGAAGLIAFRGRTSATRLVLRRVAVAALLGLSAVSILYPSGVTTVAHFVGVGRGTDLVVYILAVTFLLSAISLYRRVHDLEDKYVDLVRELAISRSAHLVSGGTDEVLEPDGTPNLASPLRPR